MLKKRKFFIVCAVLAGIGLLLTGAGAVMGGFVNGIQIDAHGIHVYAPALAGQSGERGMYEQEEERLEAFDRIEIDVEYADIRIERSDSDAYQLSYCLSGDSRVQQEVRDGKLTLKNGDYSSGGYGYINVAWFLIGTGSALGNQKETVVVRLPEAAELSDVVLVTDSGDVTCEHLQAERLQIEAEYGDISLTDVQAKELETDLDSGKLRMEQVRGDSCKVTDEYGDAEFYDLALTGEMKVEMESGDVKLRNAQMQTLLLSDCYGNVDGQQTALKDMQMSIESGDCIMKELSMDTCQIDASYGDVNLELAGAVKDYGYQLRTDYGTVSIAGETVGEAYVSLDKEQEKQIQISCESGNIKIR